MFMRKKMVYDSLVRGLKSLVILINCHGLKPLVYAHIFEIIFIEFGINTRLAVGIQEP